MQAIGGARWVVDMLLGVEIAFIGIVGGLIGLRGERLAWYPTPL